MNKYIAGKLEKRVSAVLLNRPVYILLPFLIILPFLTPYVSLATQIIIYAIFASGFNILFGYTGLISFGHAAYFGLGAYGAGLALYHFSAPQWMAFFIGITLATSGGVVFGYISLRTRGAYFALITLAFSQILYFIAFTAYKVTGGDDGLRNIPILDFKIFGLHVTPLKPLLFYYFIVLIAVLCVLIIWRLLNSPFGRSLTAIKENESRALSCGINVKGVKLFSFVLSSFFSGVAGALILMFQLFVHPESLHWVTSGDVVVITLLGGRGTFLGPFLGAGVYLILRDWVSTVTESWQLIVGILFILCVIYFPGGIWGSISVFLTRTGLYRED